IDPGRRPGPVFVIIGHYPGAAPQRLSVGTRFVVGGASGFDQEDDEDSESERKIGIIVAAAACLWSSASLAQQADSPLKSVLKMMGFATDVAPPAQRERRASAPRSRRRFEVWGLGSGCRRTGRCRWRKRRVRSGRK